MGSHAFVVLGMTALLTACGSTAVHQEDGGGLGSAPVGDVGLGSVTSGLDRTTAGPGLTSTTTAVSGAPGTRGAAAGTSSTTLAAPSTGAAGAGRAGSAGGQVGPGVSATEIVIGRTRLENAGAANAAMGFAVPEAPTDQYDAAMVGYINSHGGAAGRRLKLNYYTIDAQGSKTQDQLQQEQCEQWTQDTRVFAVMGNGGDVLRNCLDKKGVPLVYENVFSDSDNATFARFRSYYAINSINLSHLGDELPTTLAAGGYFSPPGKTGVVTFDDPAYNRGPGALSRTTMAADAFGRGAQSGEPSGWTPGHAARGQT